jgi:hypothetical protein
MIPEDVYLQASIDQAMSVLYLNEIKPEVYKAFYEARFAKEYAHDAILDAKDWEREQPLTEHGER